MHQANQVLIYVLKGEISLFNVLYLIPAQTPNMS